MKQGVGPRFSQLCLLVISVHGRHGHDRLLSLSVAVSHSGLSQSERSAGGRHVSAPVTESPESTFQHVFKALTTETGVPVPVLLTGGRQLYEPHLDLLGKSASLCPRSLSLTTSLCHCSLVTLVSFLSLL